VVDASVGVKCLRSGEPLTRTARALLDAAAPGLLGLLSTTDLFDLECGSALVKAGRRGEITPAAVASGLALLKELPLSRVPARPLATHAGLLAAERRITIYDAVYVLLAVVLDVPLVTADERLVRALAGTSYRVVSLADVEV
jgi:predicted nucleic acid-binding protein